MSSWNTLGALRSLRTCPPSLASFSCNAKQTMWSVFPTLSICGLLRYKSPWSFAHIVCRDHVNRARNADHTVRVCEKVVYSIVKRTRLYSYQTWQTHFCRNSRGAQRHAGFYFLLVLLGFWLAGWANSEHMEGFLHMCTNVECNKMIINEAFPMLCFIFMVIRKFLNHVQ